jgi:hypothetical protein
MASGEASRSRLARHGVGHVWSARAWLVKVVQPRVLHRNGQAAGTPAGTTGETTLTPSPQPTTAPDPPRQLGNYQQARLLNEDTLTPVPDPRRQAPPTPLRQA